jgi:hypothetical protein
VSLVVSDPHHKAFITASAHQKQSFLYEDGQHHLEAPVSFILYSILAAFVSNFRACGDKSKSLTSEIDEVHEIQNNENEVLSQESPTSTRGD